MQVQFSGEICLLYTSPAFDMYYSAIMESRRTDRSTWSLPLRGLATSLWIQVRDTIDRPNSMTIQSWPGTWDFIQNTTPRISIGQTVCLHGVVYYWWQYVVDNEAPPDTHTCSPPFPFHREITWLPAGVPTRSCRGSLWPVCAQCKLAVAVCQSIVSVKPSKVHPKQLSTYIAWIELPPTYCCHIKFTWANGDIQYTPIYALYYTVEPY